MIKEPTITLAVDATAYADKLVQKCLLEPSFFESIFDRGVGLILDRLPAFTLDQDVSTTTGTDNILLHLS